MLSMIYRWIDKILVDDENYFEFMDEVVFRKYFVWIYFILFLLIKLNFSEDTKENILDYH